MLSLLLAISLATITAQTRGPVSAPTPVASPAAPGHDCRNALLNLSSCLTYVKEGSNLTVPEKGCCRGLSSLVSGNPVCLCQLLGNGDALGSKIDRTKALMLSTACKLDTLPVSLCSAVSIPVPSPKQISPAPATRVPAVAGTKPATTAPGSPTASLPANTNAGSLSNIATTSMATITISTLIHMIISLL